MRAYQRRAAKTPTAGLYLHSTETGILYPAPFCPLEEFSPPITKPVEPPVSQAHSTCLEYQDWAWEAQPKPVCWEKPASEPRLGLSEVEERGGVLLKRNTLAVLLPLRALVNLRRHSWGPATATAMASRVQVKLYGQGYAVVPPDPQPGSFLQ